MSNMRLDLLEKKLEVMQSELSQILGELQSTIQAIAGMSSAGIKGLDIRIGNVEADLKGLTEGQLQGLVDHDTPAKRESGVEL